MHSVLFPALRQLFFVAECERLFHAMTPILMYVQLIVVQTCVCLYFFDHVSTEISMCVRMGAYIHKNGKQCGACVRRGTAQNRFNNTNLCQTREHIQLCFERDSD